MKMETTNKTLENLQKLKKMFPEVFTEAKDENGEIVTAVDAKKLEQILSTKVIDGDECYDFTWVGKKQAVVEACKPIRKTLRPCREESVDWENTQNLYIEGDNLDVLKLLQESYLNKVKMIYIDPPYNTGSDFIYNDTFTQNLKEYNSARHLFDEQGLRLKKVTDTDGNYHSKWCSMMYPRLKMAQKLLSEDGVIFISIDDHEQANLKKICDEIFGEGNFVGCVGRITKKSNNKGDFWAPNFDYMLTYVKNVEYATPFSGGVNKGAYNLIEESGDRKGEAYQLVRLYMSSIRNRNPEQRFWIECPDGSKIIPPGSTFPPERPKLGDGIWRWTRQTFEENKDRIVIKKVRSSNLLDENKKPAQWNVYTKTYLNDVIANSTAKPNNFIEDYINQIASHELNDLCIPFDYAKPSPLIKYLIEVSQIKATDIILDFFSGSATTAHAVMQLNAEDGGNRKFIMVQVPEPCDEKSEYKNICEIGKERIRRAGEKIVADTGRTDLDIGFRVFKLDSSNMKDVYYAPADYSQTMLEKMASNIKDDRTPEDLLYACMLEWGIELSLPHKVENIAGFDVHIVNDGVLVACFDAGVSEEAVKQIAEMKPVRAVFRDSGFATDAARVNVGEIFELKSPHTTVKVI